jgi:hypothetical protein
LWSSSDKKIEDDIRGDMDRRQDIYRRYRVALGQWEKERRKWVRLLIDKAEDDLAREDLEEVGGEPDEEWDDDTRDLIGRLWRHVGVTQKAAREMHRWKEEYRECMGRIKGEKDASNKLIVASRAYHRADPLVRSFGPPFSSDE